MNVVSFIGSQGFSKFWRQEEMVISLPRTLTVDSAINFLNEFELACFSHFGRVTIDCGRLGHVEPYSMILLASGIRSIVRRYSDSINFVMRGPFPRYPRFMGLFGSCGFQVEFDSTYSKGNKRYQQIFELFRFEVTSRSTMKWTDPIDEIEIEAARIAQVLAQSDSTEFFRHLKYMLTEMMRNWYEHSEGESLFTCAQYWPTKDRVECGLLDSGIGLRSSLIRNSNLNVPSDKSALDTALLPGVSGKDLNRKFSSPWRNSGYGLYMTSQLCISAGEFLVMSGDSGLVIGGSGTRYFRCAQVGTGVRIVLIPSKCRSLAESLERIRVSEKLAGRAVLRSPSTFGFVRKIKE